MKTIDLMEFRKRRLKELANKVGGNAELGRRLGYKSGAYISNMLNDLRPISEKFIALVESTLGCDGWFSQTSHVGETSVAGRTQNKEGVTVPLLAAAASMGSGDQNYLDDAVVGALTISPSWIDENLKPVSAYHNLRFLHAFGDSMEPTFKGGDILIIDSGIHAVDVDGIYVLEAQNRLFIKRVTQDVFGKFTISSDNQMVKTVSVLDGSQEVEVHGRVLGSWAWKRM